MRAALMTLVLAVILLPISTRRSMQAADSSAVQVRTAQPTPHDRDAVNEFNRRFVEGCRKFDPEGTAAMWAADGVDLLPGMEPMRGKAVIEKWLVGMADQIKGAKILQCDVDWQQIQISGDVAYEWGVNTQTVSLRDRAGPVKNKGKITLILRRQPDGVWKIALESWNSSPQQE